jgi:hypothetical protein
MRPLLSLRAGAMLCAVFFFASSAASQPAANPQVVIEYVAPRAPALVEVHQRLKAARVLELLQEFLSPLRLPRPLPVKLAECGAFEVAYSPGQALTICYEFVREVEVNAPATSAIQIGRVILPRQAIITGGVVNVVLAKVAYAILDMLEVPIWGRKEDAADAVAALAMLEFSPQPEVIWAALAGTSWFLAQRSFYGTGSFSDTIRPAEAQRFYTYACMAYGAYRPNFEFLVSNGDLPDGRARYCAQEYRAVKRAFAQTIMPHVDVARLQQVRALDWAARMQLKSDQDRR